MATLLETIKGIQVTVHMFLLPVETPAVTQVYFEHLFNVCTFDFIPTDNLYVLVFQFEEEEPFTANFEAIGYEGI